MPWPWSRRTPSSRFVILFPGRTGSSHLVSCLGSHPAVVAEGERLVRQDAAWQQRWIREFYGPRAAPVPASVGFKTKLKDVWDLDAFGRLLAGLEVRVIELARRDIARLAVSTLNARRLHEQHGRWNRTEDTPPLGPLAVTGAELEESMRLCEESQEELRRFVRALGRPTLSLDYEELRTDTPATLSRVLRFLDVPDAPMASSVAKATEDDLRVALADYDAHRRHFAGTRWAASFT